MVYFDISTAIIYYGNSPRKKCLLTYLIHLNADIGISLNNLYLVPVII